MLSKIKFARFSYIFTLYFRFEFFFTSIGHVTRCKENARSLVTRASQPQSGNFCNFRDHSRRPSAISESACDFKVGERVCATKASNLLGHDDKGSFYRRARD